jgi:hypothetical protein
MSSLSPSSHESRMTWMASESVSVGTGTGGVTSRISRFSSSSSLPSLRMMHGLCDFSDQLWERLKCNAHNSNCATTFRNGHSPPLFVSLAGSESECFVRRRPCPWQQSALKHLWATRLGLILNIALESTNFHPQGACASPLTITAEYYWPHLL